MKSEKILATAALSVIIAFFSFFGFVASAGAGPVIAVIKGRNIAPYNQAVEALKQAVASRNSSATVIEFLSEGETLPAGIIDEIKKAGPQVIFALGTAVTRAARQVFSSSPVVFLMVLDPQGNNISPPGVSLDIPPDVKLKELKRIIPGLKTLGVIYSSAFSGSYGDVAHASNQVGLRLIGKKADTQKEFSDTLNNLLGEINCFLMIPDPNIYLAKTTENLLLEALQKKVSVVGLSSFYTKAGALVAFDCDYDDLGRQAAELISGIIDGGGSVSADIIMKPRKIKFSLNLKVAERLGISIPADIVDEAGEVFGK